MEQGPLVLEPVDTSPGDRTTAMLAHLPAVFTSISPPQDVNHEKK